MIHNNLFIFNFRVVRKILNRLVIIIVGVFSLCYIFGRLNCFYVQENDWSRILWHNYYMTTENIDNIFVGSSHVYCNINPELLDEINNMNNFNISLQSMRLNGAYYAIKEVSKDYDLKNIYLELYYVPLTGETGDVMSNTSLIYNWGLTDYIRPSFNKLELALTMSKSDKYLETLFPFLRYREHLFDISYISTNIEEKKNANYHNFYFYEENDEGIIEFRNKGYLYTTIQMSKSELFFKQPYNLQNGLIPSNTEVYLRKIIEYCQDSNINIELFIAPIYASQVLSAIEYDLYNQQISAIANEYGVAFYDFNLCKSEHLDIMHREYFMDAGHLNYFGASIFTPFMWEIMTSDYEENQKFFCKSYEEKLNLDVPEIYGVYYSNESGERKVTIASNRKNGMEYQVIVKTENGEERILQEFSENKDFILTNGEHGIMTIASRMKMQSEQLQVIEIEY